MCWDNQESQISQILKYPSFNFKMSNRQESGHSIINSVDTYFTFLIEDDNPNYNKRSDGQIQQSP